MVRNNGILLSYKKDKILLFIKTWIRTEGNHSKLKKCIRRRKTNNCWTHLKWDIKIKRQQSQVRQRHSNHRFDLQDVKERVSWKWRAGLNVLW